MKKVLAIAAALAVLCLGSLAQADVFDLGPGLTNLETVTVGDPGYPTSYYKYGSVSYTYNIGKYEVTAGQYTAFLNAVASYDRYGLYSATMWGYEWSCQIRQHGAPGYHTYTVAEDWANRPVTSVNFWSAVRFANWLHNGQPTGQQNTLTTEDGAYFVNRYTGKDGRTIQRKSNWKWAVTSEDEWHKAAYYKGGMSNAHWLYPTQSDSVPSNAVTDPDGGNNANFGTYSIGSPYYRTEVGEFENSASAYGTFDQGGNVSEWTERIMNETSDSASRRLMGGSYGSPAFTMLGASLGSFPPNNRSFYCGFRVVQAVPEPSSIIVLAGGLMLLGVRRRRA